MPHSAYRFNQTALGLLAVLLLLVVGLAWQEFRSAADARMWVGRTYASMDTIQDIALALREVDSAQHRFRATGDVGARSSYEGATKRLRQLMSNLQITNVTGSASSHTALLNQAIEDVVETWNANIAQIRVVPNIQEEVDAAWPVASMLTSMRKREEVLLSWRLQAQAERGIAVRWFVFVGALIALMGMLWSSRAINTALRHSERAEAEQRSQALRLRVILDSLEQGVGVFTSSGQLLESNARLGFLVDLTTLCADVSAGKDVEGIFTGTQFDIRRTAMPNGDFVLTVTDMTERNRAEEAEHEVAKMQAISQLTGGIAHDFNNLLTIVMGNLEMACRKVDERHAVRIHLHRITQAAHRGAMLTSQLLAFARRQPLAPKSIIMQDAMTSWKPAIEQAVAGRHAVDYVVAESAWPVMADPVQMEKAILNLVFNAAEAMAQSGRIAIRIGNAMLDDDYVRTHPDVTLGDYAVISVEDGGCGMTADVAARAFEPFFSTKPSGESRGMGLSMVFGFAKQSRGHIEIRSVDGQGTTARLFLPRAAIPATSLVTSSAIASHAPAPASKGRILMVEDEPLLREVVADMLASLGYEVIVAGSGEEGLAMFTAFPQSMDMLLTDILMPGMDGREMAGLISAIRPELPVLYMSGYPKDVIMHGGKLDHDVRLLNKPFSGSELAKMVHDTLNASPETTSR